MDKMIKKLMENKEEQLYNNVVDARTNFLKSVYEFDDECTKLVKDLPRFLEKEPSRLIIKDFTIRERHPELKDLLTSEVILSPAKLEVNDKGVMTSVVKVNHDNHHYISDVITSEELVSTFNSMLGINPSTSYSWLVENSMLYKITEVSEENLNNYTISGLLLDKKDNSNFLEIVYSDIKASDERTAYDKYKEKLKVKYPEEYYSLMNLTVKDVDTDESIIRSEHRPMDTSHPSDLSESMSVLGCTVKVLGMEDRVFNTTLPAITYIESLKESSIDHSKIRVYDKFNYDITEEFGF